jgi:hypothetical protein
MVGRAVVQVAGLTIVPNITMVEVSRLPGCGIVTGGALAVEVVGRAVIRVAGLAVVTDR